MYCILESIEIQRTVTPVWSSVALPPVFSLFEQSGVPDRALEPQCGSGQSSVNRPLCGPGLARLTLQEAGEALRRGRDLEAGALWTWFADSIQDGNNWFDFLNSYFFGVSFCLFLYLHHK